MKQDTKKYRFKHGAPPHVGWWNVQCRTHGHDWTGKPADTWGWWNGEYWSVFASEQDTAEQAAEIAESRGAGNVANIAWCDCWPEKARVERKAP